MQSSTQQATETQAPQHAVVDAFAEFRAGVTAALRAWSALRTAVEGQWGGPDSAVKAEDLRANIFHHFDGSTPTPRMTIDELEDNLAVYMEEEFSVVLEDNSERQVADVIWRMYEACGRGDVSLAREVVLSAAKMSAVLPATGKTIIQTEDGDSDDDEKGAMVVGGSLSPVGGETNAEAYAADSLFAGGILASQCNPAENIPPPRQLGEREPEKPKEEVDDDGFAVVVPKKNRRGNRNA